MCECSAESKFVPCHATECLAVNFFFGFGSLFLSLDASADSALYRGRICSPLAKWHGKNCPDLLVIAYANSLSPKVQLMEPYRILFMDMSSVVGASRPVKCCLSCIKSLDLSVCDSRPSYCSYWSTCMCLYLPIDIVDQHLSGVIDHVKILLIDSTVFAEEVEPTGAVPMQLSLERLEFNWESFWPPVWFVACTKFMMSLWCSALHEGIVPVQWQSYLQNQLALFRRRFSCIVGTWMDAGVTQMLQVFKALHG